MSPVERRRPDRSEGSIRRIRPGEAARARAAGRAGAGPADDEVAEDQVPESDVGEDQEHPGEEEPVGDEPTEEPPREAELSSELPADGHRADEDVADEDRADEDDLAEPAASADRPRRVLRPGGVLRHLAPFRRLYRGETSFDFVGRRRLWFLISGLVILAGIASLSVRGFNFGIDFKGGTSWTVSAPGVSQAKAQNAVTAAGLNQPTVEILGGRTVQVQGDINSLPPAQQRDETAKVTAALKKLAPDQEVSITTVGPTWGGQVTEHALIALLVFFLAVAAYISIRFEPKMALAAFIALLHDLLVTAGVYSLAGFQVTPDTVVAVLTILGYSLYDTVVVFDRVRDNTRGVGTSGRMTYSEMVNLSMNQTLARSINTSLVAILPVLAVLIVGAYILGAVTLQDYGLALVVGLLSGAYSSIFIASPVLAMLKEREPRYAAIRQRIASRGDRLPALTPSAAASLAMAGGSARTGISQRAGDQRGPLRPGAAKAARGNAAGAGSNGAQTSGSAGQSRRAGAAVSDAGARGPSATGARRPPPRPRKGDGRSRAARKRR